MLVIIAKLYMQVSELWWNCNNYWTWNHARIWRSRSV